MEYSAEEVENEPEIKKNKQTNKKKNREKRKNNIFDYISNDAKRHN